MCVLPDGHLVKRATISHTKKEPRSLLFPLKRGFFEDGAGSYVVIGEICPLGCWEFQTREL